MKISYRSKSGRMLFEIVAANQKEAFAELASLQSVFEAAEACGLCSSPNLQFRTRVVDQNTFYSLECMECSAAIQFGQHRSGSSLFLRKDETWKRYKPAGAIEGGQGGQQ